MDLNIKETQNKNRKQKSTKHKVKSSDEPAGSKRSV